MSKSVILVTGCDSDFYPFMEAALNSLAAINIDHKAEIGVLDLGLTLHQMQNLKAFGCRICRPVWTLDVPEELKVQKQLGLVARTALRDYFPGFRTYIWFDADAWAQTPEFFSRLVDGANDKGAAVIRENGTGYQRDWPYTRWWFGHMIAAYGLLAGVRQARKPAVNIGIMALADTAPHWQKWINHYKIFIDKRRKINLDQHAFNAALEFESLPYALVPARCNWIGVLSAPLWNEDRRLLCEPNARRRPLSVLHLAGPNKRRIYHLGTTRGGAVDTALTYEAFNLLRHPATEDVVRYPTLAHSGLQSG